MGNQAQWIEIAKRLSSLSPEKRDVFRQTLEKNGVNSWQLPIVPMAPDSGQTPLSLAQRRLWFLDEYEQGSNKYNIYKVLDFHGELDLNAFNSALTKLTARHQILRTSYHQDQGQSYQKVQVVKPFDIKAERQDKQDLEDLIRSAVFEPFDLTESAPLRVKLYQVSESHHVLVLVVHHIAFDDQSQPIFISEFSASYREEVTGAKADVAPLSIQYADYALWQQEWEGSHDYQVQADFWCKALAKAPALLELPLDKQRKPLAEREAELGHEFLDLPCQTYRQLKVLAQQQGCSLYTLLLSIYGVLLMRCADQSQVNIGTSVSQRQRAELEPLIGFFVNTLVMGIKGRDQDTFVSYLDGVNRVVQNALAHQDLPFDRLLDLLQTDRSLYHTPLFQAFFVLMDKDPSKQLDLPGLTVSARDERLESARFDIIMKVDQDKQQETLRVNLQFALDLFEPARVRDMLDSFHHIIETLISQPQVKLDKLMLSGADADGEIALEKSHSQVSPFSTGLQAFEHFALNETGLVALVDEERQWSYGELNALAATWHLDIQDYAERDVPVAILLPRCQHLITAILASWKTSQPYLALDHKLPAARLENMLAQSRCRLLIGQGGRPDWLDRAVTWLNVETLPQRADAKLASHTTDDQQPKHLAYVIYTSGSTGKPKGVCVSQQALIHYVSSVNPILALQKGAQLLSLATTAADLGHTALFGALLTGQTFRLLDEELAKDPDALAKVLTKNPVDCLKIVPSHLTALLAAENAGALLPRVTLVLGGEGLSAELVSRVNQLAPQCRVVNHYGPTEATVGCIAGEVSEALGGLAGYVSLGKVLPGYQALVLDKGLRPVPVGYTGELYIAGPALARGYLGQPGLTAERFLPHPFVAGSTMYRTGDQVRRYAGGELAFIGRIDHQVKIRGYRVELGEIEAWLKQHNHIHDAVVITVPGAQGHQLAAYLVVTDEHDEAWLRQEMVRSLPDYMVPRYLLCIPKLPLLANGKVDRNALPEPELKPASSQTKSVANEASRQLEDIWCQVLGLESIGLNDNFFELGGDSILSLQVVAKARAAGLSLTPKQLFEQPSIGQLANLLAPTQADPSRETAATLTGIWQAVLGRDDIDVEDNFFELGGDSILSLQVVAKARAAGLSLTPKQLFEQPSIGQLANLLAPTPADPSREAAATLTGIWQAVLGRDDIDAEDNFFELGGDSILSLQVVAKARAAGLELTPKQLFEQPSIAQLANLLVPTPADPSREAAATLTGIWQAVLGRDVIDIEDNFFKLGGDSILSLQVVAKARAAGLELTPKQLFEKPTIAALSAQLAPQPVATSQAGAARDKFPLLPIQEWFFEQNQPVIDHWNMSIMLAVARRLDVERLRQAVAATMARHDILRARFERTDQGWRQDILAASEPQLEHHDVSAQPHESVNIESLCHQAQASLSLSQGQVFKLVYFDFGEARKGRLLLVAHHLIIDGVSWRLLVEDILTAYTQLSQNQLVKLSSPGTHYGEWALRLAQQAKSLDGKNREYWLSQNSALSPSLPKATSDKRVNILSNRKGLATKLSHQETQALLEQVPMAYNTQINDVLLTGLARGLAGWLGSQVVTVELEGHGRDADDSVDLSQSLGWFTTRFPVQLTTEPDLITSLKSIKEQLRAIPDKGLSFGLLKYLSGEQHQLIQPEVSFNYLGQLDGVSRQFDWVELADEGIGDNRNRQSSCPHWLDINSAVSDGRLAINWSFCSLAHSEQEIAQLAESMMDALRQIIAFCRTPEKAGYTPADFPLCSLSQAQLDEQVEQYGAGQIEDIYPLVPIQQGMMFHTLKDDLSGAYFNQLALKIEGDLAPERFIAAWQQVVDANSILRTGFIWQGLEAPLQLVCKQASLPVSQLDWRAHSPEQQSNDLQVYLEQDMARGFTLAQAPLMRLALLRTDEKSWYLVWSRHHLIVDGWSSALLIKQVISHYQYEQRIAAPEVSYGRYIAWLQNQDPTKAKTFWQGQVEGFESSTPLPLCGANSGLQDNGVLRHELILGIEQTRALSQLAKTAKVTLNTVIQGAWAQFLGKYNGSADVVFGITTSGRPPELAGIEGTLGVFINTLPLRVKWRPELLCRDFLQQIQTTNVAMREHESASLTDIQSWSNVPAGQTLFETLLVFENYPTQLDKGDIDGLTVESLESHERTNYPITLVVQPGEQLVLRLEFAASHYPSQVCERLTASLQHLLSTMSTQPDGMMDKLEVFDKDEASVLSQGWRRALSRVELNLDMVQLFEQQVAARPEKIAASFAQSSLSYQALNEKANQLAHWLMAQGVGTDTLVAQCTEREPWMLISLLAIQKAGGAYVPLDPHHPKARIQAVLNQAKPLLVLTSSAAKGAIPAGINAVELEGLLTELEQQPTTNPAGFVSHQQLAYTLFTSGSTGKPKGVQISRGAFVNHLYSMQEKLVLKPQDKWLAVTTMTFDIAGLELFLPLTQGAQVVVASQEQSQDANQLLQLLESHEISVMQATPVTWQFLVERESPSWRGLTVLCGGEALPAKLAQELTEKGVKLLNVYGPTETTVWSSSQWISGADINLGQALLNNQLYVLDEQLNPVPQGVVGELYIGGLGLARGYMARPELTAQGFIPNPFAQGGQQETGGAGSRLYRTGDLVRSRGDASLDYLGRSDFQVKVRGFRIELGEIEGAIEQAEQVSRAVVVSSDERLVAYVTMTGDAEFDNGVLLTGLRSQLPDYMVPSLIIPLEKLPLNSNGKVDRKALPAPDFSALLQAYEAPETETECQLVQIWQDLLQVERVGRRDNFFELGGHSLLAVRLVNQIRKEMEIDFPVKQIFELASLLEFSIKIDELKMEQYFGDNTVEEEEGFEI